MKTVNITVKNKKALVREGESVVNGNADIKLTFTFDEEWNSIDTKTAVFVLSDGTAYYETINDNECMLPVLYNTAYVKVGVISSDVKTSTAATIVCEPCVKDEAIADATLGQDAYTQLLALINNRLPGECYTKDDVYSKEEVDIMHTLYAFARVTLSVTEGLVQLNDRVDVNAENVSNVTFLCGEGCVSSILIKTAEAGSVSVSFEGVTDYAGDNCNVLGNGEVWEFNIMHNRCIGRRWGA